MTDGDAFVPQPRVPTLWVVGIGPGGREHMTGAALAALESSDLIVGYATYAEFVAKVLPHKLVRSNGMGGERERCEWAVREAAAGSTVSLVCSGDAGVYGMAALALELSAGNDDLDVQVVPGVTAALSGAAVLGAPLTSDYCTISLSDYLTPWEVIEHRLRCVGPSDMALCLYNPSSRQRPDHLGRACSILLETRDPSTACGWVRNIGREGQSHRLLTLDELQREQVDMLTTVFVGSSQTYVRDGRLITPRPACLPAQETSRREGI